MNYSGNMPDWHQYNAGSQGARTSSSSSSSSSLVSGGLQNGNNHIFLPGASSPALDGINLTTDSRHRPSVKSSSDGGVYGVGRSYGGAAGSGSMQLSHYNAGAVRNGMMDGLPPIGISVAPASVTDEVAVAHRNSQMAFVPGSSTNVAGSVVNAGSVMHAPGMGSQSSPLDASSPGRGGVVGGSQGYVTCKAPCCNSDPNLYQHWDKYPHYGTSGGGTYRESMRQASVYPGPIDGRRYLAEVRKDCHEPKELMEAGTYPGEHRGTRHYQEYGKYGRKEGPMARAYPVGGGNALMHQNYPMQSYQFPPADYPKCPYSVKDYVRRGSGNATSSGSSKNPGMIKYHEQQSVIVQQKYQHSKQLQYQNTPGPNNPGGMANAARPNVSNISPGLQQASFYNPNHPPRDYPQDYGSQDQSVVANRMAQSATSSHVHGSFQKYHVYHQKIAMQRFSLENHLRAFSRVPGYQTHPKYQECVMRYRELLRLQQTVDYQNIIQESPKVPSPSTALTSPGVPPINLQFDQNGMLVNSTYLPPSGAYNTGIPGPGLASEMSNTEANKSRGMPSSNESYDNSSHYGNRNNERILEHNERLLNHDTIADPLRSGNADSYFSPNGKKSDQVQERPVEETARLSTSETDRRILVTNEKDRSKSPGSSTREYKNTKDFDDKPELDVRQFLANWDESEDEETGPDVSGGAHESRTSGEHAVESTDQDDLQKNSPDAEPVVEKEILPEASAEDMQKTANGIESVQQAVVDDMDDIPTIHIVESLESHGAEMDKIHTVFGNLASAVLEPISICEAAADVEQIKANAIAETETTIVLFEQPEKICSKVLEFDMQEEEQQPPENIGEGEIVESVIASIVEPVPLTEPPGSIVEECQGGEDKDEPEVTKGNSPEDVLVDLVTAEASTTTTTTTTSIATISNSADSSSSSCETSSSEGKHSGGDQPEVSSLRKQNSFTSDESHNPDDISLPDLQTSECTPISTTLNTPIHSDSEESSEHVTDLTRSTNPIEIIQNSPIISFTHSPIKIEPYEQVQRSQINSNSVPITTEHASLDFDFDEEVASNENRKYNENCDSSPESVVEELENQARDSLYEKRVSMSVTSGEVSRESSEKTNDYYHDPLVSMASSTSPVTEKTSSLEAPNVSIENPSDSVQNVDFNRSDDLDKLCDMSLDGTCMIPLIPDDVVCDEPRMPVSPMEGNCLTKILNDTLPITDLDMLDTSGNEIIDKTNGEDDVWGQVTQMEEDFDASIVEPVVRKVSNVVKPFVATTQMDQPYEKINSPCGSDEASELPDSNDANSHPGQRTCLEEDRSPATIRDKIVTLEKSECKRPGKLHHMDSNLEIQVANFNVKIHNEVEKVMDEQRKSEGSLVKGVDAIEIKINLSRGDVTRRINKSLDGKLQEEGVDEKKRTKNHSSGFSGKIRGRRRRRSMPEPVADFESKRARRMNDEETSKKPGKYRRSRRFRRSMDDKLLLVKGENSGWEHSTSSGSEANFPQAIVRNKEPWTRRISLEIPDPRSTIESKEDDQKDQTKSKVYPRSEKFKGLCRLPSPSYSSSPRKTSFTLDFDDFDVAPNHHIDPEEKSSFDKEYAHEKLRYEEKHRHEKSSNRYEELTSVETFETNLNKVPIYTTKDGRITYSPNRNYTYRALILEARQSEKHSASSLRKLSHYSRSRNSHREAKSRRKFSKSSRTSEAIKKVGDYKISRTKRSSGKLRLDLLDNTDLELAKYEYRRPEEKGAEDRSPAETPLDKVISVQSTPDAAKGDSRTVLADWEASKTPETSNFAPAKLSRNSELIDSLKNPCVNNFEPGIVKKLFEGQELEILTREIDGPADRPAVSVERESCDSSLRFFRETSEFPKTTKATIMASPSMRTVERRPQIWDLDCRDQAALSDSGLESSTTYVEAAKESRKLLKWKSTFCDRVEKPKFFVSCDKKINVETKYSSSQKNEPFSQISRESVPPKMEETRTQTLATTPAAADHEPSEIFESLDLAFPSCNQDFGELTRKKRRRKKKKELDEARPKDSNESVDLFRRCVSNDSGEFTGLLFPMPNLKDSCENISSAMLERTLLSEESEAAERLNDTRNLEPEILAPSIKNDDVNDFTSLSNCSRLLEAPSELTVATEFEDTSTQFAGESMDFSDLRACANDDNLVYDKSDSFLDENATDPTIDCSKKSDDSGKAPILSFSGQIQSDASFGDSCSKSPPNLTHETNWPEVPESPIEKPSDQVHPKIPKMIIRNIRSRPGTPTSGDLEESSPSSARVTAIPYSQELKLEEGESKIPKLKIRLEDTHLPRVIPEATKHSRHEEKRSKSKKSSKSSGSPVASEKDSLVGKFSKQSPEAEAQESQENTHNSSYKLSSTKKSSKHHHRSRSREKSSSKNSLSRSTEKSQKEVKPEKIPKLTIKKQSSPSVTKKTVNQSPEESSMQKRKSTSSTGKASTTTKKEEVKERARNFMDESNNNDSQQSLAEKVPKVIIKRASPSAEFKCELSKNDREAIIKDSKWQPEVKLRRFWVLDCMAKEPGNGQVALKVLESTLDQVDKSIWSDSGSPESSPKKVSEAKARRKSDCYVSKSESLTSKNRRKSFESKGIDFMPRSRDSSAKEPEKETSEKIAPKRLQDNNFEHHNDVIKIDSSDESQTTIEILPASPDNTRSELEAKNQFFTAHGNMGKLYAEDAIPTQFELELEIVDNSSIDSLEVPIPSCSLDVQDLEEGNKDRKPIKTVMPNEDARAKKSLYKKEGNSIVASMKNMCCSDSLVKEVLAAKEALKRCLASTRSKDAGCKTSRPRPKTAAEKKQGSGYDFVVPEDGPNRKKEPPELAASLEDKVKVSAKDKSSSPRESDKKSSSILIEGRKESNEYETGWKRSSSSTCREEGSKTPKGATDHFGENFRTKSMASMRTNASKSAEKKPSEESKNPSKNGPPEETTNNMRSYKIPKISRTRDHPENSTTSCSNEETRKSPSPVKMPILEPQIDLNFELSARHSDRDYSLSPPLITKHERSPESVSTPKQIEDLIIDSDKVDNIDKKQDNEAVTFADIVSQLAYHEKVARIYCNFRHFNDFAIPTVLVFQISFLKFH